MEDLLGMDGEPKLDDTDSRPLLLSLVGSYLKDEVNWRVAGTEI